MIKSFLIVVLLVALGLSAIITRPTEQSARAFIAGGQQPAASGPKPLTDTVISAIVKPSDLNGPTLPAGYVFKDRLLWVEVEKDGQSVYTGVLAHWFKHDPPVPVTPGKSDSPLASIQSSRGR